MPTLVCAVDDSPGAAEALRVAGRLTTQLGARLVLAHVAADVRIDTRDAAVRSVHARRSASVLLERLAHEHGLSGRADQRADIGDEAESLARIAAEEAATLIVLGARRQGRRRPKLIGALASELAATTACPVVIVPPPPRR
jgi:nucleotide-binding universal stress UspA family protein